MVNEVVTVPHVFEFESARIRVFDIDGQRAAVGADICKALDLKDPPKAMAKLDDRDKIPLCRSDTTASARGIWEQMPLQVQTVTLISEGGATDLIVESRKPEARAFRRWLTHVVWPAIRDTGTYTVAPALEGEELLAKAVIEAHRVIEAFNARIAELEPKALIATKLLDATGDLSVGDVAAELQRAGIKTGEIRLFSELEHRGWIYRHRGDRKWRVYQRVLDSGYMSVLRQSHNHPKTGELILDPPQPRVTPKGIQRLLIDVSDRQS